MNKLKAIILAAGLGSRLGKLTENIPKCMLKICDQSLIERQVKILRYCGIDDITIVTGYKNNIIDISDVNYIKNENYRTTNINESLFCALELSDSPILVSYSDIIFDEKIIQHLLNSGNGITLAVNLNWRDNYQNRQMHPFSEAENVLLQDLKIIKIKKNITDVSLEQKIGEFLGLLVISPESVKIMLEKHNKLKKNHTGPFQNASSFSEAYITDMVQELIDCDTIVTALITNEKWCEIDTIEDIEKAQRMFQKL